MIRDEVQINRVEDLTDFAEEVPSEQADWAGMSSYTREVIRNEYIFEECGIAVVGDEYEHSYQVVTTGNIKRFKDMQDEVGWFETEETNQEEVVEDDDGGKETYTLHGRMRAFLHAIITDGRRNGDPTPENTTVEYTKHNSLNCYVLLIKWS